jgi:20S proteasome subunit beta 7
LATGYGSYIAQPLLRKAVEGRENELSEAEARKILEDSMRVLYYRDARSIDKVSIVKTDLYGPGLTFHKYQIATITAGGVSISESMHLESSWAFAEGIRGYGAQTQ